jgi:hypothetical protein
VPIDIFVAAEPDCEDSNAPIGISAIRSSALMQLQVDQHASLLDDLMRKTNFPFLHVREDSLENEEKVESDKTLGADYMFNVDADVEWVAPPAVCAQETRNHIDRLESRIYKAQGVHRRSQDSVEAHSGLALDYEASPIYATVQSWAQRLHSFELRMWQTVGRALGVSVPADGVHYPEDFSVRPIDLELRQSNATSEIYGGYNAAPKHIQKYIDIKVGRAAERDISYLDEYQDIIDEKTKSGEEAESQAVDPGTALNGAQVASMLEIVNGVAVRDLPRETGVNMLVAAFPLDVDAAEQIMGDVGNTFFVEPDTASPTVAPPSAMVGGVVVDSNEEPRKTTLVNDGDGHFDEVEDTDD